MLGWHDLYPEAASRSALYQPSSAFAKRRNATLNSRLIIVKSIAEQVIQSSASFLSKCREFGLILY